MFTNIAGWQQAYAEAQCSKELTRCGIDTYRLYIPVIGEVKSQIKGILKVNNKTFDFTRAWRYWIIEGQVPLDTAKQLYNTVVGRTDIRALGDCTCPEPTNKIASYCDDNGVEWIYDPSGSHEKEYLQFAEKHPGILEMKKVHFMKDASKYNAFIPNYHIDSELGLYIFAETIKGMGNKND